MSRPHEKWPHLEAKEDLQVELAALKARVQELEKDKARLDFLEECSARIVKEPEVRPYGVNINCCGGFIRIAIDAAMKEAK